MKFAMIPINRRLGENGTRIVRRVLISYQSKTRNGHYKRTKLIEKDPYFKNPNSSQQYVFKDTYFVHLTDSYNNEEQKLVMNNKRYYMYDEGLLIENAEEFTAETLDQAIELFNNRKEIH